MAQSRGLTMKEIVCFSGGHSSALAAIETVRKYGKENVILLNHNISSKVEHKDIKRFKQEVADYCDLPITYANMENFEEMTPIKCMIKGGGNSFGLVHCTKMLKTNPFYKYIKQFERSKDIHIIYGFDAEEENRIFRRSTIIQAMGFTPSFPLAYRERTIEATEELGIKRPVTYRIYKHANCIGCLKAGRQHWYCVYCTRPDIWEDAKVAEETLGYSIIKGIYLGELEPQFKIMRDEKKICPTDKGNSATFWKRVNETIPEQLEFYSVPCDCSF